MANPCKVQSTVSRIQAFGAGVYQVEFSLPSRYTRYLPGQFLHLTLDEFDPTTGYWPESRVFSIASEPRLDHVTVVYSVKGDYTSRMERELRVGREVWLKLPYGDFIIRDELLTTGPVVLIAGGTGVSPYLPFLKAHAMRAGVVHLYYGVREPDHLLFSSELTQLASEPWFRLHLFLENGVLPDLPSLPGRLSIDQVEADLAAGFPKASYFLSGPPTMIKSFKNTLTVRGLAPGQIHIDEWE